jgi:hypothetical protein
MSKTFKDGPERKQNRTGPGRNRRRNISVRAVRRDPPDLRKLSRALIQLAIAESEAEQDATAIDPTVPPEPPAGEERRD